jgi:hypothetical protein
MKSEELLLVTFFVSLNVKTQRQTSTDIWRVKYRAVEEVIPVGKLFGFLDAHMTYFTTF